MHNQDIIECKIMNRAVVVDLITFWMTGLDYPPDMNDKGEGGKAWTQTS